ncbi:MAG: SPFH/Band 7/PHB domain protein, partial [Lachnospiraceae bacterium]|nr:SPFH/Band 7/PHB domain protein [Lachnospiraceae bacterium]
MFFLLFLLLLILVLVLTNVVIVPQTKAYVIEFLGQYQATWGAGLHVKIPFLSRIIRKVDLRERVSDFDPQPVITKDNVTMMIDTVVYLMVTDPKKYTYGVENPMNALENLTATTLRNIIGDMELDATLTSRDIINNRMCLILDEATDPWGIKVTRVELKNIKPPAEIQEAMEKQMKAERERREAILRAEGEKKAAILKAEGEKESAILRAEALKTQMIKEAEGHKESIRLHKEAEALGVKMLR